MLFFGCKPLNTAVASPLLLAAVPILDMTVLLLFAPKIRTLGDLYTYIIYIYCISLRFLLLIELKSLFKKNNASSFLEEADGSKKFNLTVLFVLGNL